MILENKIGNFIEVDAINTAGRLLSNLTLPSEFELCFSQVQVRYDDKHGLL